MAHVIFLEPKKIMSYSVDTRNAHDNPCHKDVLVLEALVTYVHIKLQKEMHTSWIEMKRSLNLKSDNALACCLLNTTSTITVTDSSNCMEADDLNQSHNLLLESVDDSILLQYAMLSNAISAAVVIYTYKHAS